MMKETKKELYRIIFGTESFGGRFFDLSLLVLILISILTVILESVPSYRDKYEEWFKTIEWTITILFSLEYFLRIWVLEKPIKYIFSFYGIIDLLSILPSFVGIFWTATQGLIVLRGLRLLRIFRILHLPKYSQESRAILLALQNSRHKISVFLMTVMTIVVIVATLMYSVEGPENGFTSIPESLYWSIVTITTVGYGDVAPQTAAGKMIAGILMLLGYAIIAVPTGIVTASFSEIQKQKSRAKNCPQCNHIIKDKKANYCGFCGNALRDIK